MFNASNPCAADSTTIELSDGQRIFHSLDEEGSCSFESDKLSSGSESESSFSGDELDSSDGSALISTTSATELGLGDFGRLSLESFFEAPPRGVPRGLPCGFPFGVVFGVAVRLLELGLLTGIAESRDNLHRPPKLHDPRSMNCLSTNDVLLILRIRAKSCESDSHYNSLSFLTVSEFATASLSAFAKEIKSAKWSYSNRICPSWASWRPPLAS